MARRAMIDREELFEAANLMAAEGKSVTALELHRALGGGSLTTIYKYLAEWESERPSAVASSVGAEMPDVVRAAFANAWRAASVEAARETAAIKEKAAEDIKAAQRQFEGALDAIQRLESELENDATQIDSLKSHVTELESALNAANTDKAALKATSEQLHQQVNAHARDLERLHQRESEMQKKLDQALAEREKAIKEASEMKGQVDSLRTQNSELMKKLKPS